MDNMGGGGRALLFQVAPGSKWMVDAYARAAQHPSGSSLAQDVFSSGIIPSDTDYTIYTKHGSISGINFSHVKNAYRYHTTIDTPDMIDPGSLQSDGDMIVTMVRAISTYPNLDNLPQQDEGSVYYSYLGLHLASYSMRDADILHALTLATLAVSLFVFIFYKCKYTWKGMDKLRQIASGLGVLALCMATLLLGQVFGVGIPVLIGLGFSRGSHMLAWYTAPALAWVFYSCWCLSGMLSAHWILSRFVMWRWHMFDSAFLARYMWWCGVFEWCLILLVMTASRFGSSYLAFWWVLWPCGVAALVACIQRALEWRMGDSEPLRIAFDGVRFPYLRCSLIHQHSPYRRSNKGNGIMWIITAIIGCTPPTMLLMEIGILFVQTMITITGRSIMAGDLFIGALVSIIVVLLTIIPISYVHRAGHLGVLVIIMMVSSLLLLIPMYTLFPYTDSTPARLTPYHIYNATYDPPQSFLSIMPRNLDARAITNGVSDFSSDLKQGDDGVWTAAATPLVTSLTLPTLSLSNSTLPPDMASKNTLLIQVGVFSNCTEFMVSVPAQGVRVVSWGMVPAGVRRGGEPNWIPVTHADVTLSAASPGPDGTYEIYQVVGYAHMYDSSLYEAYLELDRPHVPGGLRVDVVTTHQHVSPDMARMETRYASWLTKTAKGYQGNSLLQTTVNI
eukprot:TRINITY_DN4153_c0_g1_i5.p1 TRINITY_DN4153_c0_g1~~TRINITY_DN4153_c0_g1_i5.p1  ORF type:complete len:674 (+),score=111.84 TRINITY_DN4153_c0_g1_i5:796-2817(+)